MHDLEPETVSVAAIDLAAVKLPPFRGHLGDLEPLKASIKDVGLCVRPVVWHPNDTDADCLVIIDGARRIAALKELKHDKVDVLAFRGSLDAARELAAVLHLCVVQNNRGDEAVASHLLSSQGWTQQKIAKLSEATQGWVSQSCALVEGLAPSILQTLRSGPSIKLKEALELAAMVMPDGSPDLAAQTRQLESQRAARDEPAEDEQEKGRKLRGRAAAKAKRLAEA